MKDKTFKEFLLDQLRDLGDGMKPFRPNSKPTLRTYYEVPADIIEDRERLTVWARRAILARSQKKLSDGNL